MWIVDYYSISEIQYKTCGLQIITLFQRYKTCGLQIITQFQGLDKDRDREKKKKETILDLSKYLDKPIRVKFSGGREGKFNSAIFKLFLDLFLQFLINFRYC